MDSLMELYRSHSGKISDKWSSNIRFYEEALHPFRERPVRILEIGIQNGGSLEIWAKYFPSAARIVGCDIDDRCRDLAFDDPRITIVVGDANDIGVAESILRLSDGFDIIIDDGSHLSGDIVRTFAHYFPALSEGGIYVAEDLHCSYWQEWGGGIEDPASSLAFFRRLTDYVNREHWGAEVPPERMLAFFAERWGARFRAADLERIAQVTFRNSLVAVAKQGAEAVALGSRLIVGREATVVAEMIGLDGTTIGSRPQHSNPWGPFSDARERLVAEAPALRAQNAAMSASLADLGEEIGDLRRALAVLTPRAERLQAELAHARTRPLANLRKLVQFRVLTRLAKLSAPLSRRRAARFARSAAKRDPLRHLHETCPERADALTYDHVLREWARQRAGQADLNRRLVASLADGPLISVVVPVYNTDPVLLREMIASVQAQSYPNWELCIADDCSTDPRVRQVLTSCATEDRRVRVVFRDRNGHISRATNSAIEIARGEFIALLDHDDLLDPDALLWVAHGIRENPSARIIYTDEDKVREDGSRYEPHFKPDWNRELLYGINYISHLGVYHAALLRKVGGLRAGVEGAQDHDLVLRCIEHLDDAQILHIPRVLYSWRATAGSTAASNEAKPYATEAGRSALAEHLARVHGSAIEVAAGPYPFTYRVHWPVMDEPLVSIIIPTRDQLDLLRKAVSSILDRTTYANYEILVVDNGSVEAATLEWLSRIEASNSRLRVLRDDRPFNYSALNNAAVRQAQGEIIALVNNDIEVIDEGWLREMVSLVLRPDVGCVGAKLHYPDGRIQHAGVVMGLGGVAGHGHLFHSWDSPGYFARLALRQEYTAVTGACLVVRRSVYDAVGGLNEPDLRVAFNDIDLCLKVREAGYRNLWTPWARLFHHESASRGHEDTPEKQARFAGEVAYMKRRWGTDRFADPAYNPNLSLDH